MGEAVKTPCPALSPYVDEAIEALRADGIEPTLAEVVWLSRLRERCDRPGARRLDELPGAPVEICGILFWPFHRLAESWFVRQSKALGVEWRSDLYLYAHANSARGDWALLAMSDPDTIKAAVGEWRNSLPLHDQTEADLVRLLRIMDGDVDYVPDTPDKERAQANDMAGIPGLCKMFPGTTPDYWRAGVSIAETDALVMASQANAEWATSTERGGYIEAFKAAIRWIRYAHKQGAA